MLLIAQLTHPSDATPSHAHHPHPPHTSPHTPTHTSPHTHTLVHIHLVPVLSFSKRLKGQSASGSMEKSGTNTPKINLEKIITCIVKIFLFQSCRELAVMVPCFYLAALNLNTTIKESHTPLTLPTLAENCSFF